LKAAAKYLNGLDLKTTKQLGLGCDPTKGAVIASILYLKVHDGFRCLLGDVFLTTHLPRMRDYMITHGKRMEMDRFTRQSRPVTLSFWLSWLVIQVGILSKSCTSSDLNECVSV
jgi:hypothetical protein